MKIQGEKKIEVKSKSGICHRKQTKHKRNEKLFKKGKENRKSTGGHRLFAMLGVSVLPLISRDPSIPFLTNLSQKYSPNFHPLSFMCANASFQVWKISDEPGMQDIWEERDINYLKINE